MIELKEFYWAHREVFRIVGASAGILFAQLAIMVWTIRRLRELSHIRERMSRLADALALLTDTTDAGLSTLIREVQQLGRKQPMPRSASRTAVAKRVASAARKGEPIARIAERESLSESEVRLHLVVEDAERGAGTGAAK
jgi:alcohol dehydrogenase class IV